MLNDFLGGIVESPEFFVNSMVFFSSSVIMLLLMSIGCGGVLSDVDFVIWAYVFSAVVCVVGVG